MGCVASTMLAVALAGGTASGFSSSPISTVAGTGEAGFLGDNLPASSAQLNQPRQVAVASDGSLLIADTGNHRVRRVSPGGTITTVAGNGVGRYMGDLLPATSTPLDEPAAVAPLAGGGFLIADRENHRIRKVTVDGAIATVAGDGEQEYDGDGGPATSASLGHPEDVSPTPDGGFLIADRDNDRIREVAPDGIIRTVAGDDDEDDDNDRLGDGGQASAADLDLPRGVAAISDGGFLIADSGHHRIRRVLPSGVISTVAGKESGGYFGEGVPATSAKLEEPSDVVPTPNGGFLIADRKNNRVRYVSPSAIIETVAGTGAGDYNGDGIAATGAALKEPRGVAVSYDGRVFVADTLNHRIRSFAASFLAGPVVGGDGESGGGGGGDDADDEDAEDKGKTGPDGLAPPKPPIAGKRVNVERVRGTVRIKRPGASGFTVLTGAASIPVGTVVDTQAGAVRLTSAGDLRGRRQTAIFHSGTFAVHQRRTRRPVTDLVLRGGDFSSCKLQADRSRTSSTPRGPAAGISRRKGRRGLWGRGRGRFRTRGRHGAATVRGTIWFTADRCDGTLVRVKRGVVAVRDFARRRRVLVPAGRSYLARAPGSRPRRGG